MDITAQKISIEGNNNEQVSKPINEFYILYDIITSNSSLIMSISKSTLDNITLNIVNINGQVIKSITKSLNGQQEELNIDLSDLTNGTYIYNVVSNEMQISSDKFNIVR
jgi:Secretion system C-terminal sorting domain